MIWKLNSFLSKIQAFAYVHPTEKAVFHR